MGKMLVLADGNRVGFFDTARLVSGRGNPVLGYWNDGTEAPGRTYVSVSADDMYLFVSDEQPGTITVINLAKAKASHFAATAMVGRIPVGNGPIAVTFSRDEKYLYSTSQFMDPSNDWPPECQPEWDPKAPKNPQGAVFVIDVAAAKADPTHSVVATVRAGCTPVRLILSPQGDVAYATARRENSLLAFDTRKLVLDPMGSLIGKVPTGTTPIGVTSKFGFLRTLSRFSRRVRPDSVEFLKQRFFHSLSQMYPTWRVLQLDVPSLNPKAIISVGRAISVQNVCN
jgi:DNA-binding beta-propeller fold protein YncE